MHTPIPTTAFVVATVLFALVAYGMSIHTWSHNRAAEGIGWFAAASGFMAAVLAVAWSQSHQLGILSGVSISFAVSIMALLLVLAIVVTIGTRFARRGSSR